jgi:alkylhydroperoxidase family enzyme
MPPRLQPLEPPYPDDAAAELAKLAPIALFRTLAHNPRVLGRVRRGGLLDPGAISLRERELVILRTCALCGAEYEWGVHVAGFACAAGLTRAELAATIGGEVATLPERDQPLLELCDALHRTSTVDDALWARLAIGRAPDQLVELLALAGQYHAIAYLVNGLAIALEPGAPRFADYA